MVLFIVRHGASDYYRFLREKFAGEPVHIIWDRRLGERRAPARPRMLDERAGDRRASDPPLSLRRLPFIAVPPQRTRR